jgi:GT2 family glycosyltransferase
VRSVTVDADAFPVEIVVVWSGYNDPPSEWEWELGSARSICEPLPGLSRARNAGIRAAHGRLIAFTDDDAYCRPGWLRVLHRSWKAGNSLVGGPLRVVWPKGTPPWITPNVEAMFSFSGSDRPFNLKRGESLVGPNMAIDRKVALALGGFDERLGHGARTATMGEDSDLCARAISAGYRLRFEPQAVVEHRIEPQAATRQNYVRRMFRLGKTLAILSPPRLRKGLSFRRLARATLELTSVPFSRRPTERVATAAFLIGSFIGSNTEPMSARRDRPPLKDNTAEPGTK